VSFANAPEYSSTMTKTKNDLPANIQTEMIQLLNARLSDAIDLELQTKQAHWDVKGPVTQ